MIALCLFMTDGSRKEQVRRRSILPVARGAERWRVRLGNFRPPARSPARAAGTAASDRRLHGSSGDSMPHSTQHSGHATPPRGGGCRTRRSSTRTLRTSARAVCATRFGESPPPLPRRAGAQSSAVCADRNGSRRVGPHARRTRTAVRVRAADCATHWSQLVPLVDRAAQGTR
jgi:hypothetical protein